MSEKKRHIRTNWAEGVVPSRVPPNRKHNSPVRSTSTAKKASTPNPNKTQRAS